MGSMHIFDSVFFGSGEDMGVEVRDVLVGEEPFVDEDIEFGSSVLGQLFIDCSDSGGEVGIFGVGEFEDIFYVGGGDDQNGVGTSDLIEVDEYFRVGCLGEEQLGDDVTEGAFGVVHRGEEKGKR